MKESGGPRYRLLSDHYAGDQLLVSGSEVGDGTPWPWVDPEGRPIPPSQQMEPLNDAAKAELQKVKDRVANPVDSIPITPSLGAR